MTVEKAVNRSCICRPGDSVKYSYVVDWYNQTIRNVSIVDDHLGVIAQKITLGPHEEKTFYKTARLSGNTCNTARAYGEGPCGEKLFDESNTVCVILCPRYQGSRFGQHGGWKAICLHRRIGSAHGSERHGDKKEPEAGSNQAE